MDAAGNIFIADTGNNAIRKVTAATGIITAFAGTGVAGYSGDGGPATNALIDGPTGLCVKSTGEVIISDTINTCLRQVGITGSISTLPMTVGPGLNAPRWAAPYYDTAQKKLFLYIADSANHRIRKLDTATNALVTVAGTGTAGWAGDGGQATAARLNTPSGVTVDASGNLYIADTANHIIRMVTAATGVIETVAGTGDGSYNSEGHATIKRVNSPSGVAVDTSGNIYVADTSNHRIRKFTVGGNISTIAGTGIAGYSGDGGAATAAQINSPKAVAVDGAGNIYVADTSNHRIRKFTVGGNISTVAGTGIAGYSGDGGAATAAQITGPQAVAVDGAGNIYIADTGNHALRLVNIYTGFISTMAGTGLGGYNGDMQPAVTAKLSSPSGVALGRIKGGGRIFISDTGNNRIRTLFLKTEPRVYGS